MNDNYSQFENITLRGRMCYLFMCIETYLVTLYPHKNWTPVARRMWQALNQEYLENAEDIYSEAVPEYILEFATYQETNIRAFDGNLKKEDYDEITACFQEITQGNSNEEICQVLMLPCKFLDICECCTGFSDAEPSILKLLRRIEEILCNYNIPLPDITLITSFSFDRNHSTEWEKWGKPFNAEYLSIILN